MTTNPGVESLATNPAAQESQESTQGAAAPANGNGTAERTYEIGGKQVSEAQINEWRLGSMRNKDYTQSKQALAERERELAERERILAEREAQAPPRSKAPSNGNVENFDFSTLDETVPGLGPQPDVSFPEPPAEPAESEEAEASRVLARLKELGAGENKDEEN